MNQSPPRFWSRAALSVFTFLLLCASALQYLSGAQQAEFSYFSDEPSHYVTGLMIHRYLDEWPLPSPVAFARSYYHHYPKVALGQWPPVFYVIEAAWMRVFGISPASILALMALYTAFTGTVLFWFAARSCGFWIGLAAPILFLLLTVVQESNSSIMVDIIMTGGILTATAVCGRLVESPHRKYVVQFALISVVTMLIKANAMLLALLPVTAALLTGRFMRFVRTPVVWLAVPIVLAGVVPWYLAASRIVSRTMSGQLGLDFTRSAIYSYSKSTAIVFGPVLLIAAIGLWTAFLRPAWRRELTPSTAALPAMGICCLVFHFVVPNGPDLRYMMPVFAWLCVAAAEGTHWIASRLPLPAPRREWAGAAGVLMLFTATTFKLHHKVNLGARAAVNEIQARVTGTGPVVLVVSGDIEGAVIAEAARVDPHRRWIVYRGSKIAATSTWMGRNYRLSVNSPTELKAKLDSIPAHFLLLENGNHYAVAHHEFFRRMVADFPGQFQRFGTPSPTVALRSNNPFERCIHSLPIDMEHSLGGTINLPEIGCDP